MDMTETTINQVFDDLSAAKKYLFEVAGDADLAKALRERAVNEGLASGSLESELEARGGAKNEPRRKALAQELYSTEFGEEKRTEIVVMQAKLEYDLVYIEKSRLDYLLRLAEVEVVTTQSISS